MINLELWIPIAAFIGTFSVFLYYYIKLRKKKIIQMKFYSSYLPKQKSKIERLQEKYSFIRQIGVLLENTKSNMSMQKFIMISLICGLISGVISYFIFAYLIIAVLIGIISISIPYFRLTKKEKKRLKEITIQFAPMLKHMSNYLKAGNNLRQAIEKTALVTDGKLGEELEGIVKKINGGEGINKAIQSTCEKVPLVEVRMFHIIINIHNDMGGNLAKSLDNLANVIEDKKVLRNEIDSLTQETKASAYITAIVPTVMYIAMRFASPDYMKQLEKISWGRAGLIFSFIFILLGVYVVNKMSDVKVDKSYR